MTGDYPAPNWTVRRARQGDMAMIYDSWLESFKRGDMVQDVTRYNRDMYFRYWRRVVDELMAQSTTVVLANRVWDEERGAWDDDQVVGWACGQRCPDDVLLLHYVYTKGPFRRRGIARQLVRLFMQEATRTLVYSHKTGLGRFALEHEQREHPENLPDIVVWNPFAPLDPLQSGWTREVTADHEYR